MESNCDAVNTKAGSIGVAPLKRKLTGDLKLNRVKKEMAKPEKPKSDESVVKTEMDGEKREKPTVKDELSPVLPSPPNQVEDKALYRRLLSEVNIYLSSDSKPVDSKKYKAEIDTLAKVGHVHIRGPLRVRKKLLVLDGDRTIWDTEKLVGRPHLHSFLESAYMDFNIYLWSETTIETILSKLKMMNLHINPKFSISLLIGRDTMMLVAEADGSLIRVKDLKVLWKKFPYYSAKDTVIVDDIPEKFLMNPQSGIQIRKFVGKGDDELMHLATYLKILAKSKDLRSMDHASWRESVSSGVSQHSNLSPSENSEINE